MHSERTAWQTRRAAFACVLLSAACAGAEPARENDLKAAFVFNFAVFTEWPAEVLAGGAPINLCAGASNPMLAALNQLNDKLVNGHRIAVHSGQLRGCHVLVLDRHDRARWPQIKRDLAGANVLTVSDDRSISGDGAVIALSVEDQRVGFDIDTGAARGARLNLSSKLLRLARSVQ
ncbi:MAG: YfiR family protein [Pseudomonadota bacterium]